MRILPEAPSFACLALVLSCCACGPGAQAVSRDQRVRSASPAAAVLEETPGAIPSPTADAVVLLDPGRRPRGCTDGFDVQWEGEGPDITHDVAWSPEGIRVRVGGRAVLWNPETRAVVADVDVRGLEGFESTFSLGGFIAGTPVVWWTGTSVNDGIAQAFPTTVFRLLSGHETPVVLEGTLRAIGCRDDRCVTARSFSPAEHSDSSHLHFWILERRQDTIRWRGDGEQRYQTGAGEHIEALALGERFAYAATHEEVFVFPADGSGAGRVFLRGEGSFLQDIALFPDGSVLAVLSSRELVLHDTDTGARVESYEHQGDGHTRASALVVSPDGSRIAQAWRPWARRPPTAERLWVEVRDRRTGGVCELRDPSLSVNALAFDPTSRRLATLSGSRLRVWDLDSCFPADAAL